MATVYAGTSGRYETVGSTVKIGNFKSKEAEGARIKFHDVNLSTTGKDYLKGGAHKYGELKSATSTYRNGTATGEVVYEAIKKDVVHTMKVSTSSDPIETHPTFRSKIGGTESKPLHQAIFEDKKFEKFPVKYLASQGEMKPDDAKNAKGEQFKFGDQNRFAGVTSYLNASATWTRSFSSTNQPTLAGLGKISLPSGDPPTPQGRNWLYTGFSASFISPAKGDKTRQIEGQIVQEWKLSARKGWDKDIYGEKPPEGKKEAQGNNPNVLQAIGNQGGKI